MDNILLLGTERYRKSSREPSNRFNGFINSKSPQEYKLGGTCDLAPAKRIP